MSSSIIHPTPKRGGMHPIYGAFVGGGIMDKNYNIVNPRFRCVSQLRTIKQLLSTQNALEQARDNISGVKFHGNLEVEESKLTTELDKRTFIEKVELLVKTYGFQSFFYLQGPDGKMQSLLTHSHLFTLSDVIKEHRKRDGDHVPTLNDEGDETAESIAVGHSKYDDYELMDCSLSRLAVQSVVGARCKTTSRPGIPISLTLIYCLEMSTSSWHWRPVMLVLPLTSTTQWRNSPHCR
jgi:hypothetical protein